MMRSRIVVVGGSGFIGQEICRLGRSLGHEMISISPGGRPEGTDPWLHGVKWVEGDALEPATWEHELEGAEAVVHCVGILVEEPESGKTYTRLNEQAAITVARVASRASVEKFVFISAGQAPPLVSNTYLATKRQAEEVIAALDGMTNVFLRPTLVYGPERPVSAIAAVILDLANRTPLLQKWIDEIHPLRVERVAMTALRAALEPEIRGVLEEADIETIGDAMMIQ